MILFIYNLINVHVQLPLVIWFSTVPKSQRQKYLWVKWVSCYCHSSQVTMSIVVHWSAVSQKSRC